MKAAIPVLMSLVVLLPGCGRSCDAIEAEARELKEAWQACDPGDTCEIVDLTTIAGPNNCIGAFQCFDAFPEGADLDALAAEVAPLVDEMERCGRCVMADCPDPAQFIAWCDADLGRCVIDEAQGIAD